jgi:carboxypeptidase C (cathepsin A)
MNESVMDKAEKRSDQPFDDPTIYGSGPDDSISDMTENVAITHQYITINKAIISYTTNTGHLVINDESSGLPSAKIFYVSFTANDVEPSSRPVTFFYNGGPGSSSVYLLLGSFGPRRIKTSMPNFTPPAPYSLEDNADSLLDRTDLVFINPVGTGYSTAISPGKNIDFWGVDEDAKSIRQFIKRYLTKYDRWNSPKFLFGESYGTPRTCVLTWLLHEDGVDLNGIILQSSILDYAQPNGSVGILPTFAADALFHNQVKVSPLPTLEELDSFMETVEKFACEQFSKATYPNVDPTTLESLSQIIGIPTEVLMHWKLDLAGNYPDYLIRLLKDQDLAIGAYDGRVTANDAGIAGSVDPNSGGNDPTITAVGGVYTTMWNVYLNEELKYKSTSPFVDLNDQVYNNWNFDHVDPTNKPKGGPGTLYTAGDLAASMELNPYLKVFCAAGYFDAVTPFFQTMLDLENMPLGNPKNHERVMANLVFRTYQSGHMIYLDNDSKDHRSSRSIMKDDLGKFYDGILQANSTAVTAELASHAEGQISRSQYYTPYRRRFNRTPY